MGLETVIAAEAPPAELRALAAARHFPGAVPAKAPRGQYTVTIDIAVPGWHGFGLYAPPGETIAVAAPKTAVPLNLVAQIGSHTDELWDLDSWERLPQIVRRFPINAVQTNAASSLGGLIYIDCPAADPDRKIQLTISGAVEALLTSSA